MRLYSTEDWCMGRQEHWWFCVLLQCLWYRYVQKTADFTNMSLLNWIMLMKFAVQF